jgi:hypothetical protein
MLPTGTTRAGWFEGRAAREPRRKHRLEEADKMCGRDHWTPRPGDTKVLVVCGTTPVRLVGRKTGICMGPLPHVRSIRGGVDAAEEC